MQDEENTRDEKLVAEGIARAELICATDRKLSGREWPQVIDGYVAFYEGDRRFHIYDATTIYIDLYAQEHAPKTLRERLRLVITGVEPWNWTYLLTDENHVRELIEVITS
jgi:hypothetical protein